MGRMVSTDDGDSSIVQCFAQGITIALGLDGWVTLDAGAQSIIVPVAEIQMRDSSLCGD